MKDRESKLKDIKLSKTKKRNSNEPLVPRLSVKEKEKETNGASHGDVDMFEFLEGLDDAAKPVPAPTVKNFLCQCNFTLKTKTIMSDKIILIY